MSSPVYRRYWLHYQQAMAWHHTHRRAYQKALEAAWGHGHGQGFGYHRRYADWETRESEGQEDEEEESSSDDEIECDVSNMEISEELRQYFAQTERHREELSEYTVLVRRQADYSKSHSLTFCARRETAANGGRASRELRAS